MTNNSQLETLQKATPNDTSSTAFLVFARLHLRIQRLFRQLLFSSLTRRIVILNIAALAVLVTGILYLNQFRDGLIEAKIKSLCTQGKIIAGAIAASATVDTNSILIDPQKLLELQAGESVTPAPQSTDSWDFPINPEQVAPLLRRLITPKTTRARIYDRDATLLLDSRVLYSSGEVFSYDLPPLKTEQNMWDRLSSWYSSTFYGKGIVLDREQMKTNGIPYPEVYRALNGSLATAKRRNKQGQLIVSVAVPVQRYRAVVGALLLSTTGSDIDNIVKGERLVIFKVFAVVGSVLLVLSLFLAHTIAHPLSKLSASANRVRNGNNQRVEIPDFSMREDEIGHLSTSIRDMTNALYMRIEAIERFAADVSHELKNPLTSLRSAVETLPLAKNEEAQEKLLEIIQHDVRRLDRLITDISDASRLDAELARETAEIIDMTPLLESLVHAVQEVYRNTQTIDVSLNIIPRPHGKAYLVLGHELRLGQVISNLLENARSFIPRDRGKICITMKNHASTLILTIEDNGPGIRSENIERIFERFYTDRPNEDAFGQNSGLGLSISRQIIEAHNGTITAENIIDPTLGKSKTGARFIIMLPLAK
ncbi:two-component system sensor histidine kinase ChvG [Bartonella fuyuanensis]|uniref:histidine kinase n=1 Tax=Bartonella fuyuanensis TaxID=1460968 RepID=A0A840E169_9HYPH|nr:sensor histidine kinase [Bartonella fuyuanensis]MBB4075938.1 two-component system sensor histidine kinase ChvG [Bartonella fuyuanensis]